MKPLLIILFSILFVSNLPGQFSTANVIGQTADSLGLDNNSTLNRQESILLNTLLKNSRDTFDFTNKKIVFVTGSSGNRLNSKSNFFKNHVKPWIDKGSTPSISFVQLPSDEIGRASCRARESLSGVAVG